VVLSRTDLFNEDDAKCPDHVTPFLFEALEYCAKRFDEIFVIGGERAYAEALFNEFQNWICDTILYDKTRWCV